MIGIVLVRLTYPNLREQFGHDPTILLSFFGDGLGWSEYEMRLAFAWSLDQQYPVIEAGTEYSRARKLEPDQSEAYEMPGQLYERRKMWERISDFTHLLDTEGRCVSGQDGVPQGGVLPTAAWLEGEVVTDAYHIPVPADISPGQYVVAVGFYDSVTMARLPAIAAGGRPWPDEKIVLDQYVMLGGDEKDE